MLANLIPLEDHEKEQLARGGIPHRMILTWRSWDDQPEAAAEVLAGELGRVKGIQFRVGWAERRGGFSCPGPVRENDAIPVSLAVWEPPRGGEVKAIIDYGGWLRTEMVPTSLLGILLNGGVRQRVRPDRELEERVNRDIQEAIRILGPEQPEVFWDFAPPDVKIDKPFFPDFRRASS